jgi:hypothetical protein
MQSEFDKEIDSLLREGARRGRATPVEWGAGASKRDAGDGGALLRATPSGAHLDVDEQNAYAENSLPSSARTHYAAHLADCDACRRSVTQLALAAGIPAQLEQHAAATGQEVLPNVSWRERVGAWFAPSAWRYAVPALALLLVSAVALTVLMRGRQPAGSIARNNTAEQTKQPALPETHHAAQSGNNNAAAPVVGEGALTASNSNAPVTKEELAAAAPAGQPDTKAGVISNEDAAPPPPLAAGAATTSSAPAAPPAAVEMPVPMPTPIPPAEPLVSVPEMEQRAKVSERADETAKDVQKQGNYENNQSRDRISGPRRNEQSRNMQRGGNISIARDGADKNDAVLSATPTPAPPAATAARRVPQREADDPRNAKPSDDTKKSEGRPLPKSTVAETRNVAGRKFRRTGSAWVDTAYSSQAVTVVRRNSEQYRALVADEPELRRISDALGGEVTVVWKGRAYRIR